MPSAFDFGVIAIAVAAMSFYGQRVFWPRFRAAVAGQEPDVRVRAYRHEIVVQWIAAGVLVAMWAGNGRTWSALRLTPPGAVGWMMSVFIVLSMIGLTIRQLRAVEGASVERLQRIRARLSAASAENSKMEFLMPRTLREYRWFLGLSVTAGVCEELMCRGYFTWVLAPWLGAIGAVAVVSVGFGVGHAYQGRTGIVKTAMVGAVMGAIMLATGWVIPAMIAHALIDAGSGTIVFGVLRDTVGTVGTNGAAMDRLPSGNG